MKLVKALAVGITMALAGVASAQNYSIATGGTGGVYYPMGGGLAAVLSKQVPGVTATAEVTGGSVDNLKLVGSDTPYLGFSMADAAKDAVEGTGKFSGRKVDAQTLLVLYPNRMHIVTTEASGVKSLQDLKGKRISTGSPGSATEVMAFRVLEAAGIDKDKDVTRERLGAAESVNAMKDRKIEAFFWVGGLPTAAVTDLANTPGTQIVMIDHADTVAPMNQKYGNLYFEDVIPMSTYAGMQADNKNASVSNILVVNGNMSEEEAYKITKAIFDNMPELLNTHREFASVKLENQKAAATPLPFHPGALKYFKEQGVSVQ